MPAVDVHELHLTVGDAVLVGGLEHEGELVANVLGLEGHAVVVVGALEHLGDRREVYSERDVVVALVAAEPARTRL